MRICILCWKFPARSETFIFEHVMGLRARGHEVVVISGKPDAEIKEGELVVIDNAGIERIVVGDFGGGRLRSTQRMFRATLSDPSLVKQVFPTPPWTRSEMFQASLYKRAIDAAQPDIVHIHYGALAGPVHRLGLPAATIVTWHGYDANQMPRGRSADMYHEMFTARYHHTVGSSFMRKRLEALGASADAISRIPMGIDLNRFSPRRRDLRGPLRIISVGRLDEMKGHGYLIQAVVELLREGEEIILRIVGGGPLHQSLLEQIDAAGCQQQIELLGPRMIEDVQAELYDAHVFALTGVVAKSGRVETQGVAYAEAQATGLPVIASDVGGVAESLVHGSTGLICPPANVEAIKQAVKFFITNRDAVNEFGARGRAFVESRFSRDAMLDAFESLYRDQIGAS